MTTTRKKKIKSKTTYTTYMNSTLSTVLKEMCKMAGKLSIVIGYTVNPAEKTALIEQYTKLNEEIEKATQLQFKENDAFYRQVIDEIKATDVEIRKFHEQQQSVTNFIKYLAGVIENIHRLFFGFEKKVAGKQ